MLLFVLEVDVNLKRRCLSLFSTYEVLVLVSIPNFCYWFQSQHSALHRVLVSATTLLLALGYPVRKWCRRDWKGFPTTLGKFRRLFSHRMTDYHCSASKHDCSIRKKKELNVASVVVQLQVHIPIQIIFASNKERVDEGEFSGCDGWWDHRSPDHRSLLQDAAQTVTMSSRCAAIAAAEPVHILRASVSVLLLLPPPALHCTSRVGGKPPSSC